MLKSSRSATLANHKKRREGLHAVELMEESDDSSFYLRMSPSRYRVNPVHSDNQGVKSESGKKKRERIENLALSIWEI